MLDPLEAEPRQGRDRAERIGIWISGIGHTVLVLWAIIGGALFAARENPPSQLTEVVTISTEEFEELAARSRGAGPVGQADGEAPEQPLTPGDTTAPEGPDLALDIPRPDSSATALPQPSGQPEPAPDLSDFENAMPPVEVATLAPGPVQDPSGSDESPAAPGAESTPATVAPERPEVPEAGAAPDPSSMSALALTNSRYPPERPDELREAVLAARRIAETEAAAIAAAQAEQQAERERREAEVQRLAEEEQQAAERAAREVAERAEAERRMAAERAAEEARRQAEAERRAEAARVEVERRAAEEARQREEARRAEEERWAEAERRAAEEARLAREAEERAAEEAHAAAAAELARERDLAERLAEERRLQEAAAFAQEATPSPFDGNAPEGEGEGGGSDVLTDALNEAGAAAIEADQLDDALADAMGETRPSELPRDDWADIATVPMTEEEKEGFRDAVQSCWNLSTLSTDASETRVVVGFVMNRDGIPDPDSFRMVGDPDSDIARQQAFEAARRAVLRCAGDGYDLPADKYNEWDDVEMTFTPSGVEGLE
ncbi:MAG: protein TolA [Paracoccus sp. (in: a-proteobacteria)]